MSATFLKWLAAAGTAGLGAALVAVRQALSSGPGFEPAIDGALVFGAAKLMGWLVSKIPSGWVAA